MNAIVVEYLAITSVENGELWIGSLSIETVRGHRERSRCVT